MTFCGSTVLPTDFDILRPFSSSVKPWVSTTSNGARPRVPQLSSSDDWNQPRCWSEPSRYITVSPPPSALRLMPAKPRKVHGVFQHERMRRSGIEPDVADVVDLLPFLVAARVPRNRARASSLYQASAPSCSKASAMRLLTARRPAGSRRSRRPFRARTPRSARPRRAGARSPSPAWTIDHAIDTVLAGLPAPIA